MCIMNCVSPCSHFLRWLNFSKGENFMTGRSFQLQVSVNSHSSSVNFREICPLITATINAKVLP